MTTIHGEFQEAKLQRGAKQIWRLCQPRFVGTFGAGFSGQTQAQWHQAVAIFLFGFLGF
jgi:hypothetical protein